MRRLKPFLKGLTIHRIDDREDYGETREISIGMIDGMAKKYKEPLTPEKLAARPDSEIDHSDIPELDETFWKNAVVVPPKTRPQISLRLPAEVVEHFKVKYPKGYTSQMAAVLESYVKAHTPK
ncbi:MAG: BrnA antitoxin family protein [Hyphomicrobiales bacterium]